MHKKTKESKCSVSHRMSYYLEHEGSEHLRVLRATLLAWAKEDQDIYLVSQVGAQKQTISGHKQTNIHIYIHTYI